MAIVKMSKFHLFILSKDNNELLKALQRQNLVNFNDLEVKEEDQDFLSKVPVPQELVGLDETITNSKWAIDLLEKYETKPRMLESLKEGQKTYTVAELKKEAREFPFREKFSSLKSLDDRKNKVLQEIENMKTRVSELEPWSDVELRIDELKKFKDVKIIPGNIPDKFLEEFKKDVKNVEFADVIVYDLKDKMSYAMVIYLDEKKTEEEITELIRLHTFSQTDIKTKGNVREEISLLKEKIGEKENELNELEKEIKAFASDLEGFRVLHDYLKQKRIRLIAENNFVSTEKVNIIEGYVPTESISELEELLKDVTGGDYYWTYEEASVDDKDVPIKLKNNKVVKNFEMLTEMYSMPQYGEIDPTPLFAPFYFIFSGIMIGDAGYGLLVFILTRLALKVLKLNDSTKKMVSFISYISVSSIIWGLIFGSFFGDAVELPALINPSEDYYLMIGMSLLLGGIHLFFALGIKAYMNIRDKKFLDAVYDVGFWYMAVIGAIVFIIAMALKLNSTITNIGKWSLILGLIGIVLTGGRTEDSVGAKLGWGLYSAYGITSYIGDFVSYLRLMALALAGAFIAIAVNMIVRMLFSGGIIGIIAGSIIFVIFQLFNAFLSYLSAYVHTARLTYVEMFNKFYEGGGRPFKEMIAKSEYFNIREE